MKNIDIAMTAVLRPNILDRTLDSIVRMVCRDDRERYRLIINVDPVGESVDPLDVVSVAGKHFRKIKYRIAHEPSFPDAVKWVWSQTETEYIFHWEDDVLILRPIDVDHMISIMERYHDLSSLRLFKNETPSKPTMRVFDCFWEYNPDGFYVARDWRRQFGLNPILIRREFVKEAVQRMRTDKNPEKQFRITEEYMVPLIKKWKYGIYAKPGESRLIDGRQGTRWRDKMGLTKPSGQTFVRWVKNGGQKK